MEELIKALTEGGFSAEDAAKAVSLVEPLGAGGIKALNAERDARQKAERSAKDLKDKLEAADAKLAEKADDGTPEWQRKFAELETKLADEAAARQKAEADAAEVRVGQLRTERITAKGLPAALARKVAGSTAEEIDAEIDADFLPYYKPGPHPNPQQGSPSSGKGGTLAAGAALYANGKPK